MSAPSHRMPVMKKPVSKKTTWDTARNGPPRAVPKSNTPWNSAPGSTASVSSDFPPLLSAPCNDSAPSTSSRSMMKLGDGKYTGTPLFKSSRPLSGSEKEAVERMVHAVYDLHTTPNYQNDQQWVTDPKHVCRVPLDDFLREISNFLNKEGVPHSVYLVGGAASSVVVPEHAFEDIDVQFSMTPANEDDRCRIFGEIREFVKCMLHDKYVEEPESVIHKQFVKTKCESEDAPDQANGSPGKRRVPLWSLLSLYNHYGRHIDLKFSASDERSYVLFGDSIQVNIDSLVKKENRTPLTVHSPTGYLELAINCLKDRLIYTKAPEEIFGGGLLKYANVLQKGQKDLDRVPQGWVPMRMQRTPMVKKFLGDHFKRGVNFEVISKYMETHYPVFEGPGKLETFEKRMRFLANVETVIQEAELEENDGDRGMALGVIRKDKANTSLCIEKIRADQTERARRFAVEQERRLNREFPRLGARL